MINYTLIGDALKLYKAFKYQYIETPWWVGEDAMYATIPKSIRAYCIDAHKPGDSPNDEGPEGYLVGSAEQGLIQLMLNGKLKAENTHTPTQYVAVGPCFRNEPVVDELRLQSFFKVELMLYIDPSDDTSTDQYTQTVLTDARYTMSELTGHRYSLKSVQTDVGYDLELGGIEIGSYGYREFQGHRWVYGTGLALPRFTQALEKYNA